MSGVSVKRVANVNVPAQKHVCIAITYIYGIGRATALKICSALGIAPTKKLVDLTDTEFSQLDDEIRDKYTVEGDLRREISMNIKRLKDLGCRRGIRHRRGYPVRGQRTKTNAKTRKKRGGSVR